MRRPPTDAEVVLSTHVSRYLLDDERLVAAVRRHPARIVEPFVTAFLSLLVAVWIEPRLPAALPGLVDALWLAWLAVLTRAIWAFLQWRKDWFVATDRRLLLIYGVATRKVAMMPLSKVTDLSYNRSPVGRLLGYGEFVLESAGQEQALHHVQWLPRPDALYRRICAEMFHPSKSYWKPKDRPPEVDGVPESVPGGRREDDTGEIQIWPPPQHD